MNFPSMQNLHSSRKKIRNVIRDSSRHGPRGERDENSEYFNKRFSSPLNSHIQREFSIPFIRNAPKFVSRNSSVTTKTKGRAPVPSNNIFDEIRRPKKIVSREIYVRKQHKLMVNKSRSKTVRGSQLTKAMKYKPVLKSINK